MTQNQTILKHLKRRTITTLQAFTLYGITRLSARIFDLHEMGYDIESPMVKVKTRTGFAHVARYKLKGRR